MEREALEKLFEVEEMPKEKKDYIEELENLSEKIDKRLEFLRESETRNGKQHHFFALIGCIISPTNLKNLGTWARLMIWIISILFISFITNWALSVNPWFIAIPAVIIWLVSTYHTYLNFMCDPEHKLFHISAYKRYRKTEYDLYVKIAAESNKFKLSKAKEYIEETDAKMEKRLGRAKTYIEKIEREFNNTLRVVYDKMEGVRTESVNILETRDSKIKYLGAEVSSMGHLLEKYNMTMWNLYNGERLTKANINIFNGFVIYHLEKSSLVRGEFFNPKGTTDAIIDLTSRSSSHSPFVELYKDSNAYYKLLDSSILFKYQGFDDELWIIQLFMQSQQRELLNNIENFEKINIEHIYDFVNVTYGLFLEGGVGNDEFETDQSREKTEESQNV